jgi:hypothetical protein
MLIDRTFLDEANKQMLPLDPVSGKDAEEIVRRIYASGPALLKKVYRTLE